MNSRIQEIKNQLHALKHLVQKLNVVPLNEARTTEGLTILEQGIQEVLEKIDAMDE
ncbi:hypothetical protein K1I76_09435 [Streptococcus sanguinis]|jgi:hypothetical protein|uniref:hypothetical protein n=1 Tax=Streptococcus sanguinis TaxID=1305 RepID=UPI001639DEF6|nr:hypothetical protein [Streptococcus sanguinis]MBZ2026351.1 hypothetical protein [Streptococcus sanguinis]